MLMGCFLYAPSQGPGLLPQACALTGNQTGNFLVCRKMPNPLSHTSQGPSYVLWSILLDCDCRSGWGFLGIPATNKSCRICKHLCTGSVKKKVCERQLIHQRGPFQTGHSVLLFQVIPAMGKTSFRIIFLPTEEGSIESSLFINTSSYGVLSYHVSDFFLLSRSLVVDLTKGFG